MQRSSVHQHTNGITDVNVDPKSVLNVVVIGAGASGLCSAKHCIAHGYDVTIYEQSNELGGVWVYTDEVGKDKYGVNIHTAMYKGLRCLFKLFKHTFIFQYSLKCQQLFPIRTNTPYQLIEFPDHRHPNNIPSFPTQADILKFLHSYADRFDLQKYIKLNHLVIRVLPVENDKWEVIVKDFAKNEFIKNVYDAVVVCNGHNFAPRIPDIEGVNEFKGKLIHSHSFRTAEAFYGRF